MDQSEQSGRIDGTANKTQRKSGPAERRVVLQGALAMAVAMGVGRFVFTPILPMMEHQAHVTASDGASIATANYLGYLLGALAAGFVPQLIRSRTVLPVCLTVLVGTPPAVQPVLSHGYRPALAISGGVLLAAAVCAAPLVRRAADPAHA